MTQFPLRFRARVIRGAGRGRQLKVPTVNLDLADVPKELPEGIFACRARVNGTSYDAAMHHGPRPVFKDTPSCEVHLLDATLEESPDDADIEVVEYLREVRDFASPDELRQQMLRDIDQARAILRV